MHICDSVWDVKGKSVCVCVTETEEINDYKETWTLNRLDWKSKTFSIRPPTQSLPNHYHLNSTRTLHRCDVQRV